MSVWGILPTHLTGVILNLSLAGKHRVPTQRLAVLTASDINQLCLIVVALSPVTNDVVVISDGYGMQLAPVICKLKTKDGSTVYSRMPLCLLKVVYSVHNVYLSIDVCVLQRFGSSFSVYRRTVSPPTEAKRINDARAIRVEGNVVVMWLVILFVFSLIAGTP